MSTNAREELKEVNERIKALKAELTKSEEEQISLAIQIVQEERPAIDVQNISFGFGWDCADSPTGHCIYDDPEHDECLYCARREERL